MAGLVDPDDQEFNAALAVLMKRLLKPPAADPATDSGGWMTLADGARYAAVSEDTMRQWVADGLRFARRGRIIRVRRSDIDRFLLECGDDKSTGTASADGSVRARALAVLQSVRM